MHAGTGVLKLIRIAGCDCIKFCVLYRRAYFRHIDLTVEIIPFVSGIKLLKVLTDYSVATLNRFDMR